MYLNYHFLEPLSPFAPFGDGLISIDEADLNLVERTTTTLSNITDCVLR